MSQLFASGSQSIGADASASVLLMNTQSLGWTCWISLQSKGLSRVFSNTTIQKHQFFSAQPSLDVSFSWVGRSSIVNYFSAQVSQIWFQLLKTQAPWRVQKVGIEGAPPAYTWLPCPLFFKYTARVSTSLFLLHPSFACYPNPLLQHSYMLS